MDSADDSVRSMGGLEDGDGVGIYQSERRMRLIEFNRIVRTDMVGALPANKPNEPSYT